VRRAVLRQWGISSESEEGSSWSEVESDCEGGEAYGSGRRRGKQRSRGEEVRREAEGEWWLEDVAELEGPLARRRRPGRSRLPSCVPAELIVRALTWLAAGEARVVREVCVELVACGEADELYEPSYAEAKARAVSEGLAERWGCLAQGWLWLRKSATTELVAAAARHATEADDRILGEACDDLGRDGDEVRRAARSTCFEALPDATRVAWRVVVLACGRADPDLLADSLGAAATMVAETLSRTEPDLLRAAALFDNWACGLERASDVLHHFRSTAALRARALAAFRASYLFAVRPNNRPLDALHRALRRDLLDAPVLLADKAELADDANFDWAAAKLADAIPPPAADPSALLDALADIDASAYADHPDDSLAAAQHLDLRARVLLPLTALHRAWRRASRAETRHLPPPSSLPRTPSRPRAAPRAGTRPAAGERSLC